MNRFRIYGLSIVIALLVAIYTMTNAGRFHIVDEVSLFAVTESVALRGEIDTNTIAWTQWVNSPGEVLGAFGPDGEVYSKKGPMPAILAVPWYWLLHGFARLDFTVGMLQSTLLWNGVITALTAALLWLTAVRLGYRDRTGLVLSLLFGLTTIAWPYANQFFGEPVSALTLLLTFYGIASWLRRRHAGWMAVAGVSAGMAVTTVTAHAPMIGLLGVYALAGWWFTPPSKPEQDGTGRRMGDLVRGLAAFVVPLLIAGGLLMWYNMARFGSPWDTGYHFDSGEGFTTPLWTGLWGLIVSPYRGIFWHTPILIASLVGMVPFARRHHLEALCIAGLTALFVGIYSLWWMWWGGFAWGPRFLVPITPFWVLLLAPLVDPIMIPAEAGGMTVPAASARDRLARALAALRQLSVGSWLLLILTPISLAVQIAAVSVNYVNYEIALRTIFPTAWDNPLEFGPPAQSLADFAVGPVFGQFQMLRQGLTANSDLAWLWPMGNVQWLIVLIGGAVILTLLLALIQWWRAAGSAPQQDHRARPQPPRTPSAIAWITLLLLPMILAAVWSGEVSRNQHYGAPSVGYRAILEEICSTAQAQDVLVTIAPFSYHIPMNWMPVYCRDAMPIYGYATNSFTHPEAQLALDRLTRSYDRIWFVTGGLPVNDPENTVERWLADSAYKADDQWYEDYRLVRYGTPAALDDAAFRGLNLPLRDENGTQVTVLAQRTPASIAAGSVLPVDIVYQLDTPPPADLRWFVQLIAPGGIPAALLDTAPADGYVPFSTLPTGQELTERAGLQLPDNATPGTYQLIAGLYNPSVEGAPRLLAPDGSGFVELGKVDVVSKSEFSSSQ